MADLNVCKGNINLYCYICGKFAIKISRVDMSFDMKKRYEAYFSLQVFENVDWAPKQVCRTCYNRLSEWYNGKIDQLNFGIPMIWCAPMQHDEQNCYACANHECYKRNRHSRKAINHVGAISGQLPIPHSEAVPVPKRPSPIETDAEPPSFDFDPVASDYIPSTSTVQRQCEHIPLNQLRLNSIVRHLKLSSNQAEYLASQLNSCNLLAPNVNVTSYRSRHSVFDEFFDTDENNTIGYCNDINGLMASMNIQHDPKDWRLFIDASVTSLKAVLLYKDNTIKPVPVAISTKKEETYDALKNLLEILHYDVHKWKICADFKVIAVLSGLKQGL